MTTDIVLQQSSVGLVLQPKGLVEVMQLAEVLSRSSLIPPSFRNKAEDVAVAIFYGLEIGLSPMQALQSISVINGRPTVWGDGLLAVVRASGLLEIFEEKYYKEGDKPEQVYAVCRLRRKGEKETVESRFSWADAVRAGLNNKDTYKQYPQRMLKMRARAWALRDTFADVLKGIQVREEVEDYTTEKPVIIDAEPASDDLMPRAKAEDVAPPQSAIPEAPSIPDVSTEAATPVNDPPAIQDETPETEDLPAAQPDLIPAEPIHEVRFTIGPKEYVTKGVTKQQLLEIFKKSELVDKKSKSEKGPIGLAAMMLQREFKVEHRTDLTEAEAERYLIRLGEVLAG